MDSSALPGDEAGLHPALVVAALHRGHVGGAALAATLVHLIASGAVSAHAVTVDGTSIFGQPVRRDTVELRLARAIEKGHRHAEHLIAQGHVDGLSRIDRSVLSLLFEHIGQADHLTIADVHRYASSCTQSYSLAVCEWRELVHDSAVHAGLLDEGAYSGKAGDLKRLRREVRRRAIAFGPLTDVGRLHSPQHRLLELAVAFGYERQISRLIRFPAPVNVDTSPSAGVPDSRRWLHGVAAMRAFGRW